MKIENCTEEERQAIEWAKDRYGKQWLKRMTTSPDDLPEGYKHFYWHPFGIPEWNHNQHLVRIYLAREHGYNYPNPEEGKNSKNDRPFTLDLALEILGVK